MLHSGAAELLDAGNVHHRFGHKAARFDELRQLGAVRAALGAMVVVAEGAEAVERGHDIPDEIAVAQAAALLAVDRQTEFLGGFLPKLEESVGARVARPGAALSEHLDLDLAGVAVHRTAHFALASQREQAGLCVRERLGREGAEFALRHGLMGDAVQDRATAYSADVDGEAARIVREGRDALHRLAELDDGIRAVRVLPARVRAAPADRHSPSASAFAGYDHVAQ